MNIAGVPTASARLLSSRSRTWHVVLLFGLLHFLVMPFSNFAMETR